MKLVEKNINSSSFINFKMKKILISSIYDHNSIMLCTTKFSVDEIHLIIDNNPNEKQKKSIDLVKESLGNVVKINIKKSKVYDICGTAEIVVDLIDNINEDNEIYVNVTCGRKPQSMGLTFGSYARIGKITSIVYVTEEDKKFIYLPKLSYEITESQRALLEMIQAKTLKNLNQVSEELNFSKGISYRNFETLKNKGMILKEKDGIKLTDYGKLVLL